MSRGAYDDLLHLLSRREVLRRASGAALSLIALPRLPLPGPGLPHPMLPTDATLQAFADTMLPGRPVSVTESGRPVDPLAIAGVDALPGAVEADALALYHHPEVGFDVLAPGFVSELQARSVTHGGDFLHLGFAARVQVCQAGLDFANPTRELWEAAAAVPFTAFCAAALIRDASAAQACGYRVMGLPGVAAAGYGSFSYRRRLSSERTSTGSLP